MNIESVLLQAGVAGAVLMWFLLRTDKRLDRVEQAMDRLARAQILTLLARPDVDEPVKTQARAVLAELSQPPTYSTQPAPPK